ncbi:MAG: hypothetical protein IT521_04200 [Burkholderiales bacterium]|nr:hypothetical protein [Burkholderiales bacterium]
MKIAGETLGMLEDALRGAPVPRVHALHLPPMPWNETREGEFCALELDDGSLGLSYVLLDGTLGRLACGAPGSGQRVAGAPGMGLVGVDALAVARHWAGTDAAMRTMGFAAVNALTRHLYNRAGFVPPDATDSIGGLAPQAGEHIGMIGYFPPLVAQVTASGARLTVLELRPDLAGTREGFHITLDPRELEGCDKVLSTSTVLLNDTLDAVLAHCGHARAFAMIGPGASCLPDALFARGVTLMGGVWIEHPGAFKAALAGGKPWGTHARKFALARSGYPGIDAFGIAR